MRSYHLLREVARYHEVDLWAFNQPRLISAYFPTVEAGLELATGHLSTFLRRIHIEQIPSEQHGSGRALLALKSLFKVSPYTVEWLKSASALERLESWVDTHEYDIVHLDTESLDPYRHLFRQMPLVLDHHNVESHMMFRRARNEQRLLKRTYFYQEAAKLSCFEQRTLSKYQAHITCSADDKQRLLETNPKLRVEVIPNGISFSTEAPLRCPGKNVNLLFVGGLDWYPNKDAISHFLTEIWPSVKKMYPHATVDIVGKNPPESIVALAREDTSIVIHGFVDELSALYASASLYICPIRDGGGTKLKVLDALAHRMPLVAYNIACEGLEIQHGKHAYIAHSAQDFIEGINDLLSNSDTAQSLGDAGHRLVAAQYDVRRIGLRLAQLYNSLIFDSKDAGHGY